MKLNRGFLKIVHNFPYGENVSYDEKVSVIENELKKIKHNGYDGVVTNVDYDNGYIANDENMDLMKEKARICKALGLRLWIYDEKGYPSGAAGTLTLDEHPEIESLALAAEYRVLNSGESAVIGLPHGHLDSIGAFAFEFESKFVTKDNLRCTPIKVPLTEKGFEFKNDTDKKLLCLAFFTKPAFEGTHCQHNAFSERRYIDIANPLSGKTFIKNTYRPYVNAMKSYIEDGTVEAFFADEPSYMAVYCNLKKKPRTVTHIVDENIPLWSMVSWSEKLPERFFEKYGYDIKDNLPWLFLGDDEKHKKVREDYYTLLTEMAVNSFFKPISEFCTENNIYFSGHILLEERISDHLGYEGNFFEFLKNMHVPGMDMLDSLPERVYKKAFTPLLISSISKIHRDGDVFDEVSAHFQNKFSVKVSPQQLFNSVIMQYCLGANIFTSYYNDDTDAILKETPTGETVLEAIKRVITSVGQPANEQVALHYPIENIMSNSTSPVDVATVYDSILNEYKIPYPIDRKDLDSKEEFKSFIADDCCAEAKKIEKNMENCMYALLDNQVPFLFSDTNSIEKIVQNENVKLFIVSPQIPTKKLLENLSVLYERGCEILIVDDEENYRKYYENVCNKYTIVNTVRDIEKYLLRKQLIKTSGDTHEVVALWDTDAVLLVNSSDKEKEIHIDGIYSGAEECYCKKTIEIKTENGKTAIALPPYGVCILRN